MYLEHALKHNVESFYKITTGVYDDTGFNNIQQYQRGRLRYLSKVLSESKYHLSIVNIRIHYCTVTSVLANTNFRLFFQQR